MRVSGFTFVKNAEQYDFPVVESIRSLLPLCDELIVNVGVSDDSTLDIVRSIDDPKLVIIQTEWDNKFRARSRILAQQTNIPLYKCSGDWCFYLQADEVIHEEDYENITRSLENNLEDDQVEGLLFDYKHFYGSYDTFIDSYHWYRKEIRVIKNHLGITSWRDAQGFRVDGKKLKVKKADARIYHYGWVRDPYKMKVKKDYHDSLHHGDKKRASEEQRFIYEKHIDPAMVSVYNGSHPSAMNERISRWNYSYEPEKYPYKPGLKDLRYRVTDSLYKLTGITIGEYKNYILLKN